MSAPTGTLAAALAAVQAKLPEVRKTETATVPMKSGGKYSYTYADLADVSRAVLPLLGAHGLSFTCRPTINAGGRFVLAYSLMHSSGEREDGEYPLPASGTAQEIGSAITYGRRYVLCAVTGVAPDADDDGSAASQVRVQATGDEWENARPAARTRPQADQEDGPPATYMTRARLAALHAKLGEADLADKDKGLAYMTEVTGRGITSSKDLTVDEFRQVMDRLTSYITQNTPPAEAGETA